MIENLSRDFTLEEMLYSRVAVEYGIQNFPANEILPVLRELAKRLLQPLRMAYGGPIYITCGYRCPELNRLVGGVPSSQHVKGEAADCYVPDISVLVDILQKGEIPFDQVIWYRKRNFLHLSLRKDKLNRTRIMLA